MAYRLKPGDVNTRAFRKIAGEQVARALAVLAGDPVTPEDVHTCRKVVKRLRSMLRLVEPALAVKWFAARNRAIGKIGDGLAGAREAHVLEETIVKLETRFGSEAVTALAPLKARMAAARPGEPARLMAQDIMRVADAFREEGRKLAKLDLNGKGFAALEGGLDKTYRAARRNFARAYRTPTDDHFHELRKAVQWHWRHMALLSRSWPATFGVRIAACRDLAEILGEDHDLAMLDLEVRRAGGAPADGHDIILRFVKRRQEELRARAYALAERLFAEKPKAFTRRMEAYWTCRQPILPTGSAPAASDSDGPPAADEPPPRALAAPRLAVKSHKPTPSQGHT
ncbi:MAG: CHAD domain-containing protein [Hyphomicrobium sp.]